MDTNSRHYWDHRFASGDWESVGGRSQTQNFALAQVPRIGLPDSFSGSLLDFGCGLGDAIPVYKKQWPNAKLFAVDFSEAAIDEARKNYGNLASFHTADHFGCPSADVIISSNVIEHLENDREVVNCLLRKCRELFVIVPFEEQYLIDEHVRRYDRNSFAEFGVVRLEVFGCLGWSQFGIHDRWWEIHIKNLLRPIFGKTKVMRRLQAIYHINGHLNAEN